MWRTLIALALISAGPCPAADARFVFAGLNITPEPWNKQANLAKLERYVREAVSRGANVVATPEGFLEGYVGNANKTPGLDREKYLAAGEEIGTLQRKAPVSHSMSGA